MRTLPWLLMSALAHGALALVVLSAAPPRHAPSLAIAPVEVALVDEPEPLRPPPLIARAPEPLPAPAPIARPSISATKPLAPTTQPRPAPSPVPEAAQPVIAPLVIPSAREAALSMIELPSSPDAGVGPRGPLRSDAQRSLEAVLTEAIRRVDTVHEPVLSPKAGGGFLFEGNGFDATIDSDGSVEMKDHFVSSKWIFRPALGANGEVAGFHFFEVKYDFFAWLDRKMGNDPFRSERRWFLDRTRSLREEMAAHFHDKRVHSQRDE